MISIHKIRIQVLLIPLFIFITGCSIDNSGRYRFSKRTDINIPNTITVIQDQYQEYDLDSATSFTHKFELEIDLETFNEIEKSIKKSKYYNPDVEMIDDKTINSKMFLNPNGIWIRNSKGYNFLGPKEDNFCSVDLDSTTKVAFFFASGIKNDLKK